MNTGYYPGCSLEGTAKEFDKSLKAVLSRLEVNLQEIEDWSCCGASSAHFFSHLLSVALPVRNLILAKKQGINEVLAPCAACFNRLALSLDEMKLDEKVRLRVEDILEEKFSGGVGVFNIIQFFEKIGLNRILENKKADLGGMKLACYYGCLLVRPFQILKFDDEEEPQSMEEIISAIGAVPVKWNYKTECCGASHSIAHTDIVESLTKKILDDAVKNGAEAIVVACPMCHSNLDMRQRTIKKHHPEHNFIPVFYLTQIIGIAMNIDHAQLGLNLHYIDPLPFLEEKLVKETV